MPLLKSVRLRNVRCFRDAELPLEPGVNVIIGGNGSGKTTVLEALASLAPGEGEGFRRMPLRRGAKSGEVTLHDGTKTPVAKWNYSDSEDLRVRLSDDTQVFVYGRYRRVYTKMEEDTGRINDPLTLLEQIAYRAADDRTSTLNVAENNLARDVSEYIAALNKGREFDPGLELVWQRLNTSLPRIDDALEKIEVQEREGRLVPVVLRRGMALEFRELSDGYQAMLVVIFDLMLRFPFLFRGVKNPMDGEAIVGIDEVDLHLHPRWQRTVVSQLAELFPNTQFILTTHSPLVVQGAIDTHRPIVRMLETNGEVVPELIPDRLRRELEGAEIGSLLFEDSLFGLPSRYSVAYSAIENEVAEIENKMKRGRATSTDYEELAQKAGTLHKVVAKEDERRADGSAVSHISRVEKALIDELVKELKARKK